KPDSSNTLSGTSYSTSYNPSDAKKPVSNQPTQIKGIPGRCSSPELAKSICEKYNVTYTAVTDHQTQENNTAGVLIPPKENNSTEGLKIDNNYDLDFDDL